jgi:hypothetical protein
MTYWITNAKRDEARRKRSRILIAMSAADERVR